jgi:hypothetical protein
MNVVAFVVSGLLFLGGMYAFGAAFSLDAGQGLLFFAGILAVSAALAIPIHVMKRIGD